MIQGCTAHYLANDCFEARPGTTVLIQAACGGVGLLLSQICKLKGATVIGICGNARKCEVARTIGRADHVINYNSHEGKDWVNVVRCICPDGIDCVYDGVGKTTFEKGLKLLKPRGSMVLFGECSGEADKTLLTKRDYENIQLIQPSLFEKMNRASGEADRRVSELFRWLQSGQLKPHFGRIFQSLTELKDAEDLLESGESEGKILINCQMGASAAQFPIPSA